MPRRVYVLQGIIYAVRVAVQGLGIGRALYNDIRADEPADSRVIVAGAVVVQTGAVQSLTCELLIGGDIACPGTAVGIIANIIHQVAAAVGDQRRAGEVVLVDVLQGVAVY